MIIFWILAGGLVALALLFVVVPLSRATPPELAPEQDLLNLEVFKQRLKELDVDLEAGLLEPEQYADARRDLERELLHDLGGEPVVLARASSALGRWTLAGALVLIVPVSAVLFYLELGEPQLIERLQRPGVAESETAAGGQDGPPLEVLIQRLEERLQENPSNLDGWLMLGRTYFATDKPESGLKAIETAYALAPDQIEVQLAYAEALAAMTPGKSLEGRPAELISAALEREPGNTNARWLSGLIAFQRGQYNAASVTWKKIIDEMDPASEEAGNLRSMIEEAERRAGLPAGEPLVSTAADEPGLARPEDAVTSEAGTAEAAAEEEAGSPDAAAPAAGPVSLALEVSLDARFSADVSPEDSVFVFARAAQGPPMPLAARRLQVKDLPLTVVLDDGMAMNPALRLSAFDSVLVGARVSRSGDAAAQPGDLFGESGPFDPRAGSVLPVIIDRVRP